MLLTAIDGASRQGRPAPTLQRSAHTLKSSSATVGALALSEQAQQLEMLLRAGKRAGRRLAGGTARRAYDDSLHEALARHRAAGEKAA
jgi:HPt (histidine-containing phosphotransfer) domain-containing protein